jgi:hypothetical protein
LQRLIEATVRERVNARLDGFGLRDHSLHQLYG